VGLVVGANTLATVVTARDGMTTKTYTVTVNRIAPSSNANLVGLWPSAGSLSPSFRSATTEAYVEAAMRTAGARFDYVPSFRAKGERR